ncbi:hypothetical protein SADUNF_Sadunf07G0069000 [Salix dunnii]|uniref:Uncharacterized protein n=1 Tax=Salix dunnii TaxID=1413687 RepID=A0A835JZL7_9ROSI|nr:hypothetical protein SADUNF_Sadunf07G0069000 [Salix dunnii]
MMINMDDREWMYRRMRSGRLNPEYIAGVIEELPPFPRRSGLQMLDEVSKFTEGHKIYHNSHNVLKDRVYLRNAENLFGQYRYLAQMLNKLNPAYSQI